MRVLVVEDDKALGLFLQKGLKSEGHDVDWVGDGDAALEYAERHPPDLMLLDLGLPRRDGTEVLQVMRRDFANTSVLILTGRSMVEDRVRCLDLGADDYVLKPFSFYELLARCRGLLRRRERISDPMLRFEGLEMDRMDRSVRYDGVPVELTAREFKLLEVLMQHKGECCSRIDLLNQVWRTQSDSGTNIVDVYVTYLRKKLALASPRSALQGSIIETIRGQGYQMRGISPAQTLNVSDGSMPFDPLDPSLPAHAPRPRA
jgi:DNA-binding response OmpR family regulator